MKILYIAEAVGKAGIYSVKKGLPELKRRHQIDFSILGGDSVTGGNGLGKGHAAYLHKLGADAITGGECGFYRKDIVESLAKTPYVIRPYNLAGIDDRYHPPGRGWRLFKAGQQKIALSCLLGQSGFSRLHGDNPLAAFEYLAERSGEETPFLIIDYHAQATAEKLSFLEAVKGRCCAVIGSHTKVQTADEAVIDGTAYISDAGRTGAVNSVGGSEAEGRIREYLSGVPDWTRDAWGPCEFCGVLISTDDTGRALTIERIRMSLPPAIAPEGREVEKNE
jgi:metallophosphoesterase (TIGR00282 family)